MLKKVRKKERKKERKKMDTGGEICDMPALML